MVTLKNLHVDSLESWMPTDEPIIGLELEGRLDWPGCEGPGGARASLAGTRQRGLIRLTNERVLARAER